MTLFPARPQTLSDEEPTPQPTPGALRAAFDAPRKRKWPKRRPMPLDDPTTPPAQPPPTPSQSLEQDPPAPSPSHPTITEGGGGGGVSPQHTADPGQYMPGAPTQGLSPAEMRANVQADPASTPPFPQASCLDPLDTDEADDQPLTPEEAHHQLARYPYMFQQEPAIEVTADEPVRPLGTIPPAPLPTCLHTISATPLRDQPTTRTVVVRTVEPTRP
ncbi:hypothetical protein SARC_10429 [Sphaeroforma arctica JP610]|uniref:Uncharacterized protein n=1 Tax=Sphaeroforma arctica JP610 TaxID=667725 RepID=A0A0L0FK35_9EUKA|nr:hypothetical protein SARC_10429 [Sphaeroforma arctica JP610]KNC77105.1 hypothetical protein SARC_10429 [Sphaeroforma arctica JP610]|eukprot:XP_014151007.1 hypothetical protein SARC_10429 [Sphaeroforma arctica JP610]